MLSGPTPGTESVGTARMPAARTKERSVLSVSTT